MDDYCCLDKFNLVKFRDSESLVKQKILPLHQNSTELVIVELGSGTGKTTCDLAKRFTNSSVIGVESDPKLISYARTNHIARIAFVEASFWSANFFDQINRELKRNDESKNFADIVITTHSIRVDDPNIEIIFQNISNILKPNGSFYASISIWTDLFEYGTKIVADMFKNKKFITDENVVINPSVLKPNWPECIAAIKKILANLDFGDPQIVLVTSQIKLNSLKRVQDCIKHIYPLSPLIPDSLKLEFFSEFFEQIYYDHFEPRSCFHSFVYQYLRVNAMKKEATLK